MQRGGIRKNTVRQTLGQSFVPASDNQQCPPNTSVKEEEQIGANDGADGTSPGHNGEGIASKVRRYFQEKKPLSTAERKRLEKQRKARQIHRLRKFLTPKNAIVALHELLGPGLGEFATKTNGQETTAEIVINNIKYEATGTSKNQAKAKASEKALRDLVITQMTKVKTPNEAVENEPTPSDDDMEVCEADDVPMLHLASYALHKLFTEWQSEGFEIPFIKAAAAKKQVDPIAHSLAPKVTKTTADLPPDAATRHPTCLLAFMRPQVSYEDLGSSNDQNNREFVAGITIDGINFVGKGKSKKLARKAAAAEACQSVFGVEFKEPALG